MHRGSRTRKNWIKRYIIISIINTILHNIILRTDWGARFSSSKRTQSPLLSAFKNTPSHHTNAAVVDVIKVVGEIVDVSEGCPSISTISVPVTGSSKCCVFCPSAVDEAGKSEPSKSDICNEKRSKDV